MGRLRMAWPPSAPTQSLRVAGHPAFRRNRVPGDLQGYPTLSVFAACIQPKMSPCEVPPQLQVAAMRQEALQ